MRGKKANMRLKNILMKIFFRGYSNYMSLSLSLLNLVLYNKQYGELLIEGRILYSAARAVAFAAASRYVDVT